MREALVSVPSKTPETALDELRRMKKEDLEIIISNENINNIVSLFSVGDNYAFNKLIGKLIMSEFIMKYLLTYNRYFNSQLNNHEMNFQYLIDNPNALDEIVKFKTQNPNNYLTNTFESIVSDLSVLQDDIITENLQDIITLSSILEVHGHVIENLNKEELLWLSETIIKLKNKITQCQMVQEPKCIERKIVMVWERVYPTKDGNNRFERELTWKR